MTACLAPDCMAGGIGCDNMTVVLVCFLNGGTYEDLSVRCARPGPLRGRLHSTGSSESSSPTTSCSHTTPDTSDEETNPQISAQEPLSVPVQDSSLEPASESSQQAACTNAVAS